jgi:acetyl-CoA C-acetyltransferase
LAQWPKSGNPIKIEGASTEELSMADCFIYDHVRTPRGRGRPDGALHEVPPIDLAVTVLEAIRDRNGLDTALVDDVVLGCVDPVGEAGNDIARIAALQADYAETVPGVQINRFCASGLEATNMAAAEIMAGQSRVTIGGGVESMSRVGMGASGPGAWMADPAVAFKTYFTPQGIGADLIATRWGFNRDDVDAYAVESQQRAGRAWQEGRFDHSVVPVMDQVGLPLLEKDEHVRPATTLQQLGALKPAFTRVGEEMGYDDVAIQRYPDVERIEHVHTAGNSSGIVDGAAAILLGNKEAGVAMGLKPRARVRAFTSIGSEPCIMLTGPERVTRKVLARAGMTTADIDLFELNEAFASVVLLYEKLLDLDPARLNVNGGAIAMGHPLGATGAMILGTVLDELERTGKGTALVNLCVGAGMGTATIIERV